MFRANVDITKEPGIKYLEYMGLRILRMMRVMRGMLFFMGTAMVVASIVLSIFGIMDFMPAFYYIIGGGGGLILLIPILQTIFGVNIWYFNKIREMRDRGEVQELKRFVYGRGAKSTLAMYALVDLGEIDLYAMRGFHSGYGRKASLHDDY
jgi:hypothetical protein